MSVQVRLLLAFGALVCGAVAIVVVVLLAGSVL